MTNLFFIGTKDKGSLYILKCVLTSFVLLVHFQSFAQRSFKLCDSTKYELNKDTTVIVGRNQLYLYFNNSFQNLHNFSTLDTNEYIIDFDIVKPNLWFAVVGSRYIGYESRLYKSSNKGANWSIDTNHFNAKNVSQFLSPQFLRSINNFQHLNGDTLVMFTGYYESGIIYSTDLGKTWTKWFDNLISYYHGMFECGNKYYIFGYEGDGFRASMFGFNKNLLFSTDSTGLWLSYNPSGYHPPCYNGADTINCVFSPSNLNRCDVYGFFKNKIASICSTSGLVNYSMPNFGVYPNPIIDKIGIEGAMGEEEYHLINLTGQIIWTGKNIEQEDFSSLQPGLYFLKVENPNWGNTLKLIKQ